MLGPDDPLPRTPRRILIAGTTGAGKTTLAARLERLTGATHTEIDALHWGANWTPRDSFVDDVAAFSSNPTWVTEWQYRAVRPMLAERADLLVWLDLPRRVALPRLIRRTVRRRLRREQMWNGNIEPPFHTFFTSPETNIIRWGIRTHRRHPEVVGDAEERYAHLVIVRLRSQREVDRWVAGPFIDVTRQLM